MSSKIQKTQEVSFSLTKRELYLLIQNHWVHKKETPELGDLDILTIYTDAGDADVNFHIKKKI